MISQHLLLITLSTFFSGGAIHGLVVDKTFKTLPLSHSLGVDGIYRLDLRQSDQSIRHQMVSRAIYAAYEIGDQFDDRLSVAEVRKHHQLQQEQAEQKARQTAEQNAKAEAKPKADDERVLAFFRKQDMLPETEGF